MPLLFVLAGMSARFALENRTVREFIMQRVCKLLIPFLFGTAFLVPFQTLYARKFFDGYTGGFWENWKYFFTHVTDFSGYDGAFMPGHLWFILFLFLISMAALVLFHFLPYERAAVHTGKIPAFRITILVLLVAGKKCLNRETGITRYWNRASYPVYLLHQSILVALAYYVVRSGGNVYVQAAEVCIGSFLLTALAYQLVRQAPFVRIRKCV